MLSISTGAVIDANGNCKTCSFDSLLFGISISSVWFKKPLQEASIRYLTPGLTVIVNEPSDLTMRRLLVPSSPITYTCEAGSS